MQPNDLLFVGFNGRVAALARHSGELVWKWKCPKPSGRMVAVLVQDKYLYASSSGYTYCLDALTGEQLWDNPLIGMGTGVPCLATSQSGSSGSFLLHAQELANQQRAAHSSNGPAHGGGPPPSGFGM
jgi:outer membrane protein assembly factor BamB